MHPINTSKVLLIVNSDDARSTADADDYVIRRSLNAAHRLAFSFGTTNAWTAAQLQNTGPVCTTAPYIGQSFVPTVAAYTTANGIEAIICSTFTSSRVDPQVPSQPGMVATLPAWAAAANYFVTWGIGGLPGYFGSAWTHNTVQQVIEQIDQNWPVNTNHRVPHGRLGCPDFNNATIAELPLNAGVAGASIYDRSVTQALLIETQSQASKPHYLTTQISYSIVTQPLNSLGYEQASNVGINRADVASVNFPVANLTAGSTSPPASIFALCLAANWNNIDISNFTIRNGAWGYNWTSSAGKFGTVMMQKGASAALLSFGEPYSSGIAVPQEVFIYAQFYQVPLCLAAFLAHSNGMGYTVCGDPLYTPYKSTDPLPPKNVGFLS